MSATHDAVVHQHPQPTAAHAARVVSAASVEARNDVTSAAHPRLFANYLTLVTVLGVGLLALVLLRLDPRVLAHVPPGQLLALGTCLALVVLGEVRPVLGSGTADPNGVTLSTTFVFPVLLHQGLVPAVVLHAVAITISGLVERKSARRTLFNLGQYVLTGAAGWAVLAAAGRRPTLEHPWVPATLWDLLPIVLAAVACFAANNVLVWIAVAAFEGEHPWRLMRDDLPFQAAVSCAQYGLAPLVVVLMQHAPQLVVLTVVPMIAIERSAAASRVSHEQATHDDLTGLANRKQLVHEATHAIADSARTGEPCALFLLDLDRFKEVNDALGHQVGDAVLRAVATRLTGALRPEDLVARLGGDEFAVLLRRVRDVEAALEVAVRLQAALDVPLEIDGQAIDLEGSIGVALVPDHADAYEVLFTRADIAMYLAKHERTGVEVYESSRDESSASRMGIISGLRTAIERGQLELHYQPKATLDEKRVVGVEALVRWRHPVRGLVPPDQFIPVAEQSGLMRRLTDEVIELALAQMGRWTALGMRVPVAVNVSFRDLVDLELVGRLRQRLAHHGVEPALLTLEITERVLTADLDTARITLEALRDLGVGLSLDDFGTGWSSLRLLRELPVTEIKIDRSFVWRAVTEPDDEVVVRGLTEMAHRLGLQVVAEGIETEETWQLIGSLHCDSAQGWHLARPLLADDATRWLAERLLPGVPPIAEPGCPPVAPVVDAPAVDAQPVDA
ncbi:putative bifunctional diguanylate cyclase/phosphodiesterase [Angustibacter aerolatus]